MKLKKKLVLFLIIFLVPIGLSQETSLNAIHITGKLSNSANEIIHLKMYIINNATTTSNVSLDGFGMLGQTYNNGSSQFARFHIQNNKFLNDSVEFTGRVTNSSNPDVTGSQISIKADPLTGNMTLVFGYSNYTGIGYVSVR